MRSPKLWNLVKVLLVVHFVASLIGWFLLPTKIPVQFGPDGNPDGWVEPSLFLWFSFVATAAGLSLMIHFLSLPGAKSAWNIAEKERFLQLTPIQQAPVLELMRVMGAASALCIAVLFLALHLGMYFILLGHAKTLPWWVYVVLFGAPGGLVLGLIPWDRAVRREIKKASEATA